MIRAEITIIGGGVMGSALARELARSGRDVLVLEKAVPGAEASSAAAGILGAQAEAEGPGPFLDLCLKSRELFPAFSAALKDETGVDTGFRRSGLLKTAFDAEDEDWLNGIAAWQIRAGLPLVRITGDEARRLEPALSRQITAALHFENDGVIDNRLLVQALSLAATRAGARYLPGYTVRGITSEGGQVTGVELDRETISSPLVCVCAGSWSSRVAGLGLPADAVQPARGQMLAVRMQPGTLGRVVFTRSGYLVPRDDGRIVSGSTMEFAGFEKEVTVEGLSRLTSQLLRVVPGTAGAQVVETWAGLRPYTKDRLPVLGETGTRGLYISTGHFRNGILLTPVSALLLRQVINGETPELDLLPYRWQRLAA